jgi:serine/threonine-protein kinase RsbW
MKTLKISSTLSSLNEVEQFIENICEQYSLSGIFYGNILLAVEEATKNAIQHGNKLNPEKEVIISFKSNHNGLTFTVEDQGEGFDIDAVKNPLEVEDNLYSKTGKGIFIIRSLADKVEFGSGGKKVEIVFDIASISQETTINRIQNLQKYFKKQKSLA